MGRHLGIGIYGVRFSSLSSWGLVFHGLLLLRRLMTMVVVKLMASSQNENKSMKKKLIKKESNFDITTHFKQREDSEDSENAKRERVFDLTEVKPHEFVRYGLAFLDKVAAKGDQCARECRDRIRITHMIVEKNLEVEQRIMMGICKIMEQRDHHGDTEEKIEYDQKREIQECELESVWEI